jgi:hypothetical protein
MTRNVRAVTDPQAVGSPVSTASAGWRAGRRLGRVGDEARRVLEASAA